MLIHSDIFIRPFGRGRIRNLGFGPGFRYKKKLGFESGFLEKVKIRLRFYRQFSFEKSFFTQVYSTLSTVQYNTLSTFNFE